MSICIAAAVVLGIMGLFSAKYRRWAKEAFSCVGRRLTLRPCKSTFNQQVKAKITGKLMNRSAGLAKVVNSHFEAISWVFTIILFASLALTTFTAYNLIVYGTCTPDDPASCTITGGLYGCTDNTCDGITCLNDSAEDCGLDCGCTDEGPCKT
ncbi:MAG: hypothetical protein ABIF08_00970 [Nanoarchaeota archaeon]